MNIEYKWLTPSDAATFDRVAEDVFDESIHPARLAAYLADPKHHMIVALAAGEVVGQVAGVVYGHPDKALELFIDEVGVAPAFRRQGIARKLFNAMLERGKALGCEEAWVGTELDNVPARGLYESFDVPPEQFVLYTYKL